MRLRQIEVFDAVYATGSVTRAAERLCVSQPSVSKVLAHAEQQLGYALFERVKGRLVPTAEADRLYSHVRTVNEQVDRLRKVAKNLTVPEDGSLRIAAIPAFGVQLLPRVIARWREQHRQAFFSVSTRHHNEINRGLLESRFDLGLAFQPQPTAGIHADELLQGQLMVLAPRNMNLPDRKALRLQDLEGLPFIDLDRRGPLGTLLGERIERAGVKLNRVAEAETYHVAGALAAEGVGLTITDDITARSWPREGLAQWPLQPACHFSIAALHRDDEPLPRMTQEFLEFLRHLLAEFLR